MAVITDMGVTQDAGGILHPHVKNKWRLRFHNFGNDEVMTLQAISGDKPKLEFEKIQLDRYNSRAWIAGKHTWQPCSFTFESDIGGRVANALKTQIEKQQKLIGIASAPTMPSAQSAELYKFSMTVEQMDGDNRVLEIWAYEGVWIENLDNGDLDYTASETVKIVAKFSYDNARQDIIGVRGNATGGPAPL